MRKKTLLMTLVMVIAVIPILKSGAVAVLLTPMNPQMQQNLQDMSKLMTSISNELSTGKMSMEAQQEAASITKQVSQILQELTESGFSKHDVHKARIEKMKKAWSPWGEDGEGGSKD